MFRWLKRHVGVCLLAAAHVGVALGLNCMLPPQPAWSVAVPKGSYGGELYFVDNSARVLLANSRDHRREPCSRLKHQPNRANIVPWLSEVDEKNEHLPVYLENKEPRADPKRMKCFELHDLRSGRKVEAFPEIRIWSSRFFATDRRFALAFIERDDERWHYRRGKGARGADPYLALIDFQQGTTKSPCRNFDFEFQDDHSMREDRGHRAAIARHGNERAWMDPATGTMVARVKLSDRNAWHSSFSEFSGDGRFFVVSQHHDQDSYSTSIYDTAKGSEIAAFPNARVVAFCSKRNVVLLLENNEGVQTAFLHDLDTDKQRGCWGEIDPAVCSFSPDGRWLLLNPTGDWGADGDDLRIVEVATGRLHWRVPIKRESRFGFAGETLVIHRPNWRDCFFAYDVANQRPAWQHQCDTRYQNQWLKTDDGASLVHYMLEQHLLEFRDPASGAVRAVAKHPPNQFISSMKVVGRHVLATLQNNDEKLTRFQKIQQWLSQRSDIVGVHEVKYIAVYDALDGRELARIAMRKTAEPHLSDDGRWLVCLDREGDQETLTCWSAPPSRPWLWIAGAPGASFAGCLALRHWRGRKRTKAQGQPSLGT